MTKIQNKGYKMEFNFDDLSIDDYATQGRKEVDEQIVKALEAAREKILEAHEKGVTKTRIAEVINKKAQPQFKATKRKIVTTTGKKITKKDKDGNDKLVAERISKEMSRFKI